MLDIVVDRRDLKATISRALRFMRAERATVDRVRAGAGPGRHDAGRLRRELTSQLLDRLFALETFGIKLGLDNITSLCEGLGHPERSFTSLHVAGTNGKGSVTAMAHAALRAAGVHAGRYTSPHLSDLSERFVIGDRPVETAALEAVVDDVLACADRLRADGRPARAADVLRGDDRRGVRAVPPRRRSKWA